MAVDAVGFLATVCTWQNYTLNAAIPNNAVLIGVNVYSANDPNRRGVDFAYAARGVEGRLDAFYRVYANRKAAIGFVWNSPLTSIAYKRYDGISTKEAEIFVCDYRAAKRLRWKAFNDRQEVDLSRCVEVSRTSSDEPIFLARVDARCQQDCLDRGRMPALYMPDLGYAITHFTDFQLFVDFELLCYD